MTPSYSPKRPQLSDPDFCGDDQWLLTDGEPPERPRHDWQLELILNRKKARYSCRRCGAAATDDWPSLSPRPYGPLLRLTVKDLLDYWRSRDPEHPVKLWHTGFPESWPSCHQPTIYLYQDATAPALPPPPGRPGPPERPLEHIVQALVRAGWIMLTGNRESRIIAAPAGLLPYQPPRPRKPQAKAGKRP